MKRHFSVPTVVLVLTLVQCAWFSVAGPLRAAVIYSQTTPTPPTGAFSSNDAGNPTDQKVADSFLFSGPGPATIRSVRFIGGYGIRNPPPPYTPPLDALPDDDFRVVFFANSAAVPGAPLPGGDFHVGAAVLRTPAGGPLLNGLYTPLEYYVDLGWGISLSAGSVYWVSIVNNPAASSFWDWARAAGVFDQQVAATQGDVLTGPWSASSSGGMFFELSDNNVPEPGSLSILLAGACGVWRMRSARRAKH